MYPASLDRDQIHSYLWSIPILCFLCVVRVSCCINLTSLHFNNMSCNHIVGSAHIHMAHRFVTLLPAGWIFIVFAIILRLAEGVGTALATTPTLALIPGLYPERVSTVMVSLNCMLMDYR